MINSFSNSWIDTFGASGGESILKQASNNAWALESALFIASTDAIKPPSVLLPYTIPTVMLFIAPGFNVNGPADWTKRLSPGGLLFVDSSHPFAKFGFEVISSPPVDQCKGSESPGNI